MNLIDILYTPLDLPEPPKLNIEEFLNWIDVHREEQAPMRDWLANMYVADENNTKVVWPWNMGLAYLNWDGTGPGWLSNFNKSFPELSKYFHEIFDMPEEDLGTIVLLPVRKKHLGYGMMHQDHDTFGLRVYLEFEHIGQNKLFLQKTRVPYQTKPNIPYPIDSQWLQDDVIECKTLQPRGCWYINNARAVHCTYTEVEDSTRIAVIVSGNPQTDNRIISRMKNKIIESAEKYKDYAVFW